MALPNLSVTTNTGWCLWLVQECYGVPHLYRSAWQAWEATAFKHTDKNLPDTSVPVWFSHYGSYGTPPTYANWGHVVVWVPGQGFYSSPANGYGAQWLSSIGEVERTFNCKFVGWSEDISGVKVMEGEDMGRIQELEQMANDRQARLDQIGALYSIPAPVDANSMPQLINNMMTEKHRIDELTTLASADMSDGDAEKRLEAIRNALGIK